MTFTKLNSASAKFSALELDVETSSTTAGSEGTYMDVIPMVSGTPTRVAQFGSSNWMFKNLTLMREGTDTSPPNP